MPKRDLFPPEYHYRARHTADVINGMRELVEACATRFGDLSGKASLDVGCNDGSLLSIFAEKGARTFGVEPTDAWREAAERGHAVINAFFDPEAARAFVARHGSPDLVTFTNVFAHIENLGEALAALEVLRNRRTAIVIENHYLGAVLERFQFDTFYHEHPRTYSYASFVHISDRLGMKIGRVDFPARYNGNIRVFLVPPDEADGYAAPAGLEEKEEAFGATLRAMAQRIGSWRARKRAEIESAVARCGKLPAKAFPDARRSRSSCSASTPT